MGRSYTCMDIKWNSPIHPDIQNASINSTYQVYINLIKFTTFANLFWPKTTRLRLGLSHLIEHDIIIILGIVLTFVCLLFGGWNNPSFFLHCHYYHTIRLTYFNELCEINMNLLNLSDEKFLNIILRGGSLFSDIQKF